MEETQKEEFIADNQQNKLSDQSSEQSESQNSNHNSNQEQQGEDTNIGIIKKMSINQISQTEQEINKNQLFPNPSPKINQIKVKSQFQGDKEEEKYASNNSSVSQHSSILVFKKQFNSNIEQIHKSSQKIKFIYNLLPKSDKIKLKILKFEGLFNRTIGSQGFNSENNESFGIFRNQKLFMKNSYNIYFSSKNQEQVKIAQLEGNLFGTLFNVFSLENEERQLIATICYKSSLKNHGTARKVQIFIKNKNLFENIFQQIPNLKQVYQKNPFSSDIFLIETLQPEFNGEFYTLPFFQKSLKSSLHNTIFVNKEKQNIVKMFKIENQQYQMHASYPCSPLVAYAFSLSSLIFKIACQ